MLLYVFKQEETVERIGNAFSQETKQRPPHSSYAKTTSCLQRGHERRISCLFPVARSCLTAL